MGKDKTKDENATTDASRDQESRDAALARIIAEAVAPADQVHRRCIFKTKSRRNTITHRSISKADGQDTCAV